MYGMNDRDERHAGHSKWQTWAGRGAALLLPLSVMACPGSLADPGEFGGGANACANSTVPKDLATTCGFVGCHAGANPSGAVDLSLAAQGNLSNLTSNDDYPGMKIVDPGNPMMSVLWLKLQPNAMGPNRTMPFGA